MDQSNQLNKLQVGGSYLIMDTLFYCLSAAYCLRSSIPSLCLCLFSRQPSMKARILLSILGYRGKHRSFFMMLKYSSDSLLPAQGSFPQMSSYSSIPRDQMSALQLQEWHCSISGHMYEGVPTDSFSMDFSPSRSSQANPKSMSVALPQWYLMLSGLMSRCMMRLSNRQHRALIMPTMMLCTSSISRLRHFRRIYLRVLPSQQSNKMQKLFYDSQLPTSPTMLGCLSFFTIFTSALATLIICDDLLEFLLRIFTAALLLFLSVHRQTVEKAPVPSSESGQMVQSPSMTSLGLGSLMQAVLSLSIRYEFSIYSNINNDSWATQDTIKPPNLVQLMDGKEISVLGLYGQCLLQTQTVIYKQLTAYYMSKSQKFREMLGLFYSKVNSGAHLDVYKKILLDLLDEAEVEPIHILTLKQQPSIRQADNANKSAFTKKNEVLYKNSDFASVFLFGFLLQVLKEGQEAYLIEIQKRIDQNLQLFYGKTQNEDSLRYNLLFQNLFEFCHFIVVRKYKTRTIEKLFKTYYMNSLDRKGLRKNQKQKYGTEAQVILSFILGQKGYFPSKKQVSEPSSDSYEENNLNFCLNIQNLSQKQQWTIGEGEHLINVGKEKNQYCVYQQQIKQQDEQQEYLSQAWNKILQEGIRLKQQHQAKTDRILIDLNIGECNSPAKSLRTPRSVNLNQVRRPIRNNFI